MEIKLLNDQNLMLNLKNLIQEERRITQEILDYLSVVESRRLFAERGYSSLFDFCVKELGFSESSAQRRISSIRLMRELPEAREKLEQGQVNLSTLSRLSTFIRKEENFKNIKMDQGEKRSLLQTIENKSQRECEREFIKISPKAAKIKESQRPVTEDLTEIKFVASKELMNKLKELKNLLAHQNKTNTMAELIEILADKAIREEKAKHEVKGVSKGTAAAKIKRQVWRRDQGKCQYVDPLTKRKCESTYKIQLDHIRPRAHQGETTLENTRILCATHNQLVAIQVFSAKHMAKFVPSLRPG